MIIDGKEKEEKITTVDDAKKSRKFKSFAVVGVIIIAIIFVVNFFQRKETIKKDEKPVTGIFGGKGHEVERDLWLGKSEERLKSMEKKQGDLESSIRELTDELKRQEKDKKYPQSTPPPPGSLYGVPTAPQPIKRSGDKDIPSPKDPGDEIREKEQREKEQSEILNVKPQKTSDVKKSPVKTKKISQWLPAGSFLKGTLLTGLDAPTGPQAQARSIPVLVRVDTDSIGPNFSTFPLAECFIVGSSYGSVSEERAFIRSETLSCVTADGKSVETPIKGQVVGEDGKVGTRGRLVSKQGALLAQSLMAGFADGMSRAFRTAESTYITTPLGGTSEVLTGSALKAGIFSGISRSMEELSKFYLEMAKQTFPIIEIDAGRNIEFLVTEGKEVMLTDAIAR